jgi:hypothetical protein
VKYTTMKSYVYYSFEEWGRGYIGVKFESNPETDKYFGSFHDQTFNPTQKIVLGEFETREEALEAEVALHEFFKVDKKPHFANLARQTSTGFVAPKVRNEEWKQKISEAHKGKKLSPESIVKRQANRIYNFGEEHPFYGKTHTNETKAKIKAARAKQTNVSGGCALPWWVKEDGTRTRAEECPGEGWERGMVWKG